MKLSLPNAQQVLHDSTRTLKRFPLSMLSAAVATVISVYLIEREEAIQHLEPYFRIIHVSLLGIPLFLGIDLLGEKFKLSPTLKVVSMLCGLFFLLAYYATLPEEMTNIHFSRAAIMMLTVHCFVSVAPFLSRGNYRAFWEYNTQLFLRFFGAFAYAIMLFTGLSIALLALDKLLGVEVNEDLFAELLVILLGLFNTWFFLAGVPDDIDSLEEEQQYPTELKAFTQYVLVPLVSIYLVILYLYMIKIGLTWDWPRGMVSWLILFLSLLGILSSLLLYPVRQQQENQWLYHFSRLFYWLLLPLTALLVVASWRRISDYGFTELRYFLLAIALWLIGVTIYMLLNRRQNIKVFPLTLGIISLVTAFGPWSAFNVSRKSQLNRLEKILQEYALLEDGKLKPSDDKLSFEGKKEVSSIVSYLVRVHGYRTLQPLVPISLDSLLKDENRRQYPEAIMHAAFGTEFVRKWENVSQKMFSIQLNRSENSAYDVKGYDYVLECEFAGRDHEDISDYLLTDGSKLSITFDRNTSTLKVLRNRQNIHTVPLKGFVEKLVENNPTGRDGIFLSQSELKVKAQNRNGKVQVCFQYMDGELDKERIKLNNMKIIMLLEVK
ncbi:DUF4153 domain-containing protein [Limibacter armeniacum]|uniref:DUF4153 domain-containing protein n=1 Tax=Limibacter armeniacum TaxID=466084 RepID=UPI002FE66FD3